MTTPNRRTSLKAAGAAGGLAAIAGCLSSGADTGDAGDAVLFDDDLRAVSTVFDVASGTRRRLRGTVA